MRETRVTVRAVLILGMLALLGGCAGKPMAWYRDGATQEEFSRDSFECERESWKLQKTGYGLAGEMDHSHKTRQAYMQCMQAKGYELRR